MLEWGVWNGYSWRTGGSLVPILNVSNIQATGPNSPMCKKLLSDN